MEWISLEERSPPEHDEILLCLDSGQVKIGYFVYLKTYTRLSVQGLGKPFDDWKHKPTHWMPLPEPPTDKSP